MTTIYRPWPMLSFFFFFFRMGIELLLFEHHIFIYKLTAVFIEMSRNDSL